MEKMVDVSPFIFIKYSFKCPNNISTQTFFTHHSLGSQSLLGCSTWAVLNLNVHLSCCVLMEKQSAMPQRVCLFRICGMTKKGTRRTKQLLKAQHSTCQLAPNSLKLAKKHLVLVAKHISSAEDDAMTSIQYLIQSLLFFLTEIIISCGGYCTVRKPARLMKGEWAVCSLSEHASRPLPELAAGLK